MNWRNMKKFQLKLSKKTKAAVKDDGTIGRSATTAPSPAKPGKSRKATSLPSPGVEVSGAAVPYKDPDAGSGDSSGAGSGSGGDSLADLMRDDSYSVVSGMHDFMTKKPS